MDKDETIKRGWYLDLVMAIGHQEAKLTHIDEDICNAYTDMDIAAEDIDVLQDIANKLNNTRENGKESYQLRAALCQDLIDAFPDAKNEQICKIKHDAATYIIVAEVYHARGFDPTGENLLKLAGELLASTLSEALGVEMVSCIRCLNDSLHAKK